MASLRPSGCRFGSGFSPWALADGALDAAPPGFWPGTESRRPSGLERAPGETGNPGSRARLVIGEVTVTGIGATSCGMTAPSLPLPGARMKPADLDDQMLEAVHSGASPIPMRDRPRYYNVISAWLDACPLLTNAGLRDAIRSAQRELLRPTVEA
jgi:hypothetical protein